MRKTPILVNGMGDLHVKKMDKYFISNKFYINPKKIVCKVYKMYNNIIYVIDELQNLKEES